MVETVREIHARILNDVDEKYDRSRGSFAYDTTAAVSIELERVYKEIDKAVSKLNIENLSKDELTSFILERTGLIRHPATFATTTVIVTGQPGAIINKGDKVSNETTSYSFTESTVINSEGQAVVLIQSDIPGIAGNTTSNTITFFPVTLAGLVTVKNQEPVTNGYEEESDASLIERYYEYIRSPATSGNPAHYKIWAKEMVGVGDVRVQPTWNGGGTVKVIVIDANKRAASIELLNNVYSHIESVKPIGATVTVGSGTEKVINISATVVLANGYNIAQVQSAFEEALIKHLADIAFKQTYVSYARIGNLLLDTAGVGDYSDLEINNGITNIVLTDEEIPIVGTISLEV